jgi:anthranilate synthase component 1
VETSPFGAACDDRTRIHEPGAAGIQSDPVDRRSLCRPRDAALALPQARLRRGRRDGRQPLQLPARVGGRRRALRPLFVHRPAGRTLLRASGFRSEVVTDGRVVEADEGNPLDFIAAYQQRFRVALRPGLPRFCGGLAGYFGYDAVRYIEPRLAASAEARSLPDPIGTPDVLLVQCEEVAVIDNLSGRLYLIVYADPAVPEAFADARRRLLALTDRLRASVTCAGRSSASPPSRCGAISRRPTSSPRSRRRRTTSPPAT